MNNLWRTLRRILTITLNFLVISWAYICGFSLSTYAVGRRIIIAELIIIGIVAVFLFLGWLTNITILIWLAGIVGSMVFVITSRFANLAINLLQKLVSIVPIVGTVANEIGDELKKLLSPLTTISMFFSLIACLFAVRGPRFYSLIDVMILSSALFFTIAFMVYLNSKTRIAGWAMTVFLCYTLTASYFWPIQIQGWLDKFEGKNIRSALSASEESFNDTIVIVPPNTPYFLLSRWTNKLESTGNVNEGNNTEAKLVNRKNDPESKEGIYEVVLPIKPNMYVGGHKVWVPARLVKIKSASTSPFITTASRINLETSTKNETVIAGKTLTIELKPNQIYTVDELEKDGRWKYLSFTGSFQHRISKEGTEACWKQVENNLPWSADWSGKLQVKGGNEPVKITVNIL